MWFKLHPWVMPVFLGVIGLLYFIVQVPVFFEKNKKDGRNHSGVPFIGGLHFLIAGLISPCKWLAVFCLLDYAVIGSIYKIINPARENVSKILPIGYSKIKMGRGMAIFFMINATILSIILVNAGMEIKYTAYLFAVALGLGGLFVLTDLSTNKKNKTKISHMEKMLKCPYVVGSVVEVKKYYYGFGGKLREIKPGYYVKSKDCAYTIIASFTNAENNEVLVESEPYASSPERVIESKRVRIYYSADNEYWIDVN